MYMRRLILQGALLNAKLRKFLTMPFGELYTITVYTLQDGQLKRLRVYRVLLCTREASDIAL